jgi:3-oxoacyl-(acyl-carrier-protein) synthase
VATANSQDQGGLERPRERLEQAVTRLEAALEAQDLKSGESDAALAHTLSAAEAENAELKTLNRAVSGRLDSAIGRLKTILEG